MTAHTEQPYTRRMAAYDLEKLRAKGLIARIGRSRRYTVQSHALRSRSCTVRIRFETACWPTTWLSGQRSRHCDRRRSFPRRRSGLPRPDEIVDSVLITGSDRATVSNEVGARHRSIAPLPDRSCPQCDGYGALI
jgi:hypothetical protein